MVTEALEEVRRKFLRLKGLQTIGELAEAMQVSRQTLARFARGGYVSWKTLAAIDAWVSLQETRGVHDR